MDHSSCHEIIIPFHCKALGIMEHRHTKGNTTIPFNHTSALDSHWRKTWDLKTNPWWIMRKGVDKGLLVPNLNQLLKNYESMRWTGQWYRDKNRSILLNGSVCSRGPSGLHIQRHYFLQQFLSKSPRKFPRILLVLDRVLNIPIFQKSIQETIITRVNDIPGMMYKYV